MRLRCSFPGFAQVQEGYVCINVPMFHSYHGSCLNRDDDDRANDTSVGPTTTRSLARNIYDAAVISVAATFTASAAIAAAATVTPPSSCQPHDTTGNSGSYSQYNKYLSRVNPAKDDSARLDAVTSEVEVGNKQPVVTGAWEERSSKRLPSTVLSTLSTKTTWPSSIPTWWRFTLWRKFFFIKGLHRIRCFQNHLRGSLSNNIAPQLEWVDACVRAYLIHCICYTFTCAFVLLRLLMCPYICLYTFQCLRVFLNNGILLCDACSGQETRSYCKMQHFIFRARCLKWAMYLHIDSTVALRASVVMQNRYVYVDMCGLLKGTRRLRC